MAVRPQSLHACVIPNGAAQVVARSKADILAARGVKPTLSPNLDVLATVEALDVKRLLFIGVGCQVRRRRSPLSVGG